jgi:aldehyde:ferredoxin oxidoreductase
MNEIAAIPFGYAGFLLRVDLSKQQLKIQTPDKHQLTMFIGGSGFGAHLIYEEVGQADPLGPDNLLAFMTGPLTGTIAPSAGRFIVCARSPLTGLWGEANSGGQWGPELKFSGFDGILVHGRSKKPVYLTIFDGEPKIRDASDLWGKDTYETETAIRSEFGDKQIKVACIGPAGERQARIAGIINDKGRAAARCGLGAVMGSKKLKAIAVRGGKDIRVFDLDTLLNLRKKAVSMTRAASVNEIKYGTSSGVEFMEEVGRMPNKNWGQGYWGGAAKISGKTMVETILTGRVGCYACPSPCGRVVKIPAGPFEMEEGAGPEYETIAAFGSLCLNDNLEAIAKANDLCNRYGLDTISTGSAIAFAMECYERGIITKEDIGRTSLSFGEPEGILDLVEKIGRREKIGFLLGEGVLRASQKLGRASGKFAIHTKGLELPMHDPRQQYCRGLTYAIASRGGHHNEDLTYAASARGLEDLGLPAMRGLGATKQDEDAVRAIMITQSFMCVLDSLVMCCFLLGQGMTPSLISDIFNSITGRKNSPLELLEIGDRICNLKRIYNISLGVSRKDDTLPTRILKEPLAHGGAKGQLPNLKYMVSTYYRLRGWDRNGIPRKRTIEKLALN